MRPPCRSVVITILHYAIPPVAQFGKLVYSFWTPLYIFTSGRLPRPVHIFDVVVASPSVVASLSRCVRRWRCPLPRDQLVDHTTTLLLQRTCVAPAWRFWNLYGCVLPPFPLPSTPVATPVVVIPLASLPLPYGRTMPALASRRLSQPVHAAPSCCVHRRSYSLLRPAHRR